MVVIFHFTVAAGQPQGIAPTCVTFHKMIKKRNGEYVKQKIDVLDLADTGDTYFGSDIMLEAAFTEYIFLVPMLNIEAEEETIEAIEDWQYWKKKNPYM